MKQTGINMEMVKKKNRCSILNCINRSGSISRKDIACALGLTPAAVTQICGEFIENGVLVESGDAMETKRAGRRKVMLSINYDYRYVLGINIDIEKTVIALTNLKGEAVCIREIGAAKKAEPEHFLQQVADVCREMWKQAGVTKDLIVGAGVGIPGIVDKEKGISIHAYGIWQEKVPVAKLLSLFLDMPVVVENNVSAFALAEMIYGIGRKKDNLMIIRWGPGVGGAIVADKKIYGGRNGRAAELGHLIVEKFGRKCTCGRTGCLETKICYAAVSEQLREMFSIEKTPKMYAVLGGDFRNFSREKFCEIVLDMDEPVEALLEDMLDLFARSIVNCMTILAPNRVVLSGSMFRSDLLFQGLIACCSFYDERYDETNIIRTMLADSEDYIGAVALFVASYLYGIDA